MGSHEFVLNFMPSNEILNVKNSFYLEDRKLSNMLGTKTSILFYLSITCLSSFQIPLAASAHIHQAFQFYIGVTYIKIQSFLYTWFLQEAHLAQVATAVQLLAQQRL